jgi:5'-3' exonuclease
MGVENFFSTVNRNFNVIKSIDPANDDESKINASYLLFDFNSIIHQTSSKLIEELNQKKLNDEKMKDYKLDDIEIMIIKQVNNSIISILKKLDLDNLKFMYIALDGVPSFSKMMEQKKRRFVGDFIGKLLEQYSLPFLWSKNNISPGTIFMNKITKYLSNIKSIIDGEQIKKQDLILELDDYDYYTKVKKFEYSDTNLQGEAEMKIFDLINDLNSDTLSSNESIIFFSPDSDVILLSMISKKSNHITIFKFEQQTELLSVINIELLKQSIYIYCQDRLINTKLKDVNINKIINDIVFIFTTSGNDFLPRCDAIQISKDFLFLIDLYLIILIDNGYMIINNKISNIAFFKFLSLLKTHEQRLLKRNAYQNIYENYRWVNQKNFYIDLLKFKDSETPSEKFYDNILLYIDPGKMANLINKTKYGCLEFYLMDKASMFETLKEALKTVLPINTLFNINIDDLNKTNSYEKFRHFQYVSSLKKHVVNMKDLSPWKKEMYLIDNKLDKYSKLFDPVNSFYSNIITLNKINTPFYYKKYFNNVTEKKIVNIYLEGFKWVTQYYFDRKHPIDETWVYPYTKAPLIETIIDYYSSITIDTLIEPKPNSITTIEQLLYITPIRLSELNKPTLFMLFAEYKDGKFIDEQFVNKVKQFIESNPQFFYNLDEIYNGIKTGTLTHGLFDCSGSNFVNKCHYKILDFIINLDQFVKAYREIDS